MTESLEEHEEIVFETIQDYLNKKRVFYMDKLIPYLSLKLGRSKTNISNEGIQKILISLVKKNMIIEGTTLTKNDVLMNSTRKKIYDYLKENPGKYINRIAKELEIGNKVVFWHLNILEKFNFIKKIIVDNHVIYFDSNINLRDSNKLYLISKEKCKRIINYLKINNFGITKSHLSRDLNIHRNTIEKYVNSLEEFNIITKTKRSNQVLYFIEGN